jgi:Histone methylation protein DOT1
MQSPVLRSRRLLLASLATLPFSGSGVGQTVAPVPPTSPTEEVPYVQTPPLLVRRMLQMAEVTPRDVLWDLGSGDGRIVIAAARDFGARGVGYEIDRSLIRESRASARKAGVNARTQFLERDLFELAFSQPSVVTLYLLPEYNARLKPLLLAQMKPGSRVVSHEWDMGDWLPDETLLFPAPDKPHGTKKEHRVMLWVIPASAAGRWSVTLARRQLPVEIAIEQHYQTVTASASRGKVLWSSMRGDVLSVAWQDESARWVLRGVVSGSHWRGELTKLGAWSNSTSQSPDRFTATLQ